MNKTEMDILKSLVIKKETIKSSSNSLKIEHTAEDLKCRIKSIESNKLEQATSILPEEYQQVEYIESTGTQYIDTGYIPMNTSKVELDLQFLDFSSEQNNGIASYSGNNTRIAIGNGYNHDGFYFGVANSNLYRGTNDNNRHIFYIDFLNKNFGYDENSFNFSSNLATIDRNYTLFARYGQWVENFCKEKLYSAKFYENSILIRNFIPCYRKSDGEIGLYDLVNNVFYTNSGTGTFLKGSDVTLPTPDYPQEVEGITGDVTGRVRSRNLAYNGWAEDFVRRINNSSKAKIVEYEGRRCLFYSADFGYPSTDYNYFFKINFKENVQYTIMFKSKGSNKNNLNIAARYTDNTLSTQFFKSTGDWGLYKYTSSKNKTLKQIENSWHGRKYLSRPRLIHGNRGHRGS